MSSFPHIQKIQKLKIQPEQEGRVDELPVLEDTFENPYQEYIQQMDFQEASENIVIPQPNKERLQQLSAFVAANAAKLDQQEVSD